MARVDLNELLERHEGQHENVRAMSRKDCLTCLLVSKVRLLERIIDEHKCAYWREIESE